MRWPNLMSEVAVLQDLIVDEQKKLAPVDTGRLKKSIRPLSVVQTKDGIEAPITYIGYGIFPDFGTKYQRAQRFTERAQEKALNRLDDELAYAAGLDVLDELDLPSQITINIGE